ncbi:antiviral reverse transcriptase Drt2 [Chromatocurvus halotolerans]|uniref:Reverse transcriptase (RNA-dependent DNA polymerase) n=1 Tax=Chromatocurvus halotolerans TaxID=1132028 RepID=A0A4R2KIL0_9GAMM|nr:antiviral reverse transcriptase Drt2 [Chromatocurvus halotolerans]TCO73711.1 reverse transcriptase (RNA-dependent DNA polymerase) [Chromatocurvus halotolerans]
MATDDFSWYRHRNYLHFDNPLGKKSAEALVKNPLRVKSHSFYPLISYEIESIKIAKDAASGSIEKKKKPRPIRYAAHADSHIYSFYSTILSQKYEDLLRDKALSEHVLAFRPLGKNNIDFAAEAFEDIRVMGTCAAVALDITGFFDNIDHAILKDAWCDLLGEARLPGDHFAIFKSLTAYSYVPKLALYRQLGISQHNPKNNRKRVCEPRIFREIVRGGNLITTNENAYGIPQGSPISALLSNIYMVEFDEEASKLARSINGKYYRYCDDILFIVPIDQKDRIANKAKTMIRGLKLEINKKKIAVRSFTQRGNIQRADYPLQYLGFTFDGERILIRSAALARYSDKMKRGVKFAKATMRKRNGLRVLRGEPVKPLYRKSLYRLYSHVGRRNFLSYGYRAARRMNSPAIKRQLKPLWRRLEEEIER